MLNHLINHTAKLFPLATPRAARKQAIRLLRAKRYLLDRGICAVAQGSAFKYARATGSVLR